MSTLVIGGSGSLGAHILNELIRKGESVVSFDLVPPPKELITETERVVYRKGNILNIEEIIRAIKENAVTKIITTAAMLTPEAEVRPVEAARVNFVGSVSILEAARLTDIGRLVYTSTSSVYGYTSEDEVVTEEHPRNPMNFYGIAKNGAESYGNLFAEKYGLDFVAMRIRILYGPGQRGGLSRVTNEIITKALQGMPARVAWKAEQQLCITYVKDAAHAHVLAAEARGLPHRAYNINSGTWTVEDLVSSVKRVIPNAIVECGQPGGATILGPALGGKYDISRAQKELGYNPQFTIEKGIADSVEFIKHYHM